MLQAFMGLFVGKQTKYSVKVRHTAQDRNHCTTDQLAASVQNVNLKNTS